MMLQEKFDAIIEHIEMAITSGETDIPQTVAKKMGLNLRLLGDAFQFVTDITLAKYIRQRRLINALISRLELNLPIEEIVAAAGFSDAAAFSKACKNEFGLSPTQMSEEVVRNYPPIFFSRIASGEKCGRWEKDVMETAKEIERPVGVSAEQFAEIRRILEVSAIYGFTDEEAEAVYIIATTCAVSASQAAEFYDDFKLQLETGSYMHEYGLFDMAELACHYNLSFSETQEIMYMLKCYGYDDIHDLPDGFFDIYFAKENDRYGWNVSEICEIADAMKENGLTASSLEDVVFSAETFGSDIIEVIENYHEYENAWDELAHETMNAGACQDDTEGFGYRSIWELDE